MTANVSSRVGFPKTPRSFQMLIDGEWREAECGVGLETGRYGVEEYTQIRSTHIELGERARWVA